MTVTEPANKDFEQGTNTATEQGNRTATMVPLTRAGCGEKLG
jgi:hypothetical protein